MRFQLANIQNIQEIRILAEKIWNVHYISIISKEQIDFMLEKMYSKQSLFQQMTKENHQFYLVFINEIAVGYASISTNDGKQYFLHKLYLDISHHKKGVGTQFLTFLEIQHTPETLQLTVNRNNHKAINFYLKHGFVIEKEADFDIGNGFQMNDFVMIKNNLP